MKQYTHAWLAFMAIKRLEDADLSDANRTVADSLIRWFKNNKDGVIRGAWYPDSVIKDNANSHVLKFTPDAAGDNRFKDLPSTYLMLDYRVPSGLYQQPYTIDEHDNLPDRCESLAQAVIDNLKIQYREDKGSAVAATDNHIAQLLFMLSHYVADAHMPLHCDSRRFSSAADIHGHIEGGWEHAVEEHYPIDRANQRFLYDPDGYPLREANPAAAYAGSVLARVETELNGRPFRIGWGGDNTNVWDFMTAVCQHSYLMAYALIPQGNTPASVTPANLDTLNPAVPLPMWSVALLSDAIDSMARIWLRIWRRYLKWEANA
jgi:hypothetical protein